MSNRRALAIARALARLAAGVPAPTRNAARRSRYGSEVGRYPLGGAAKAPGDITEAQLVSGVRPIFRQRARIHLVHAGTLMYADDVIKKQEDFYTALTESLVRHVVAAGPTPVDAMERLLGAPVVRGRALSLDERCMRFTKALMTMEAELLAHGHNPAILLDPRWFDTVTEFSRAYIMRYGYEHGLRFELRQMVLMEQTLTSSVRALRHQRRLPGLAGKQLYSGPDTILHSGGLAYLIQLKAFRSLESLFAGSLSVKTELGLITKVAGPAIPKQTFTDCLRCKPWQYRIPGAAMEWDVPDVPDAAILALWDEVAMVGVNVIDDTHLLNGIMALFSDAVERTGRWDIDLVDDLDASPELIDGLTVMLADRIEHGVVRLDSPEALWDSLSGHLLQQLTAYEVDLSRYFGRSDVFAQLGRRQNVKLVAASQGPRAILAALGIAP